MVTPRSGIHSGSSAAGATTFAIVLLFAALLRIAAGSGFVDQDDREYIDRAYQLTIGNTAQQGAHQGARIALALPTALSFSVFGVGRWQVAAFPFVCSLLGVWLTWRGALALFDARTAILAALLLAAFPLDAIYATILSPTAPIGLCAGAAVVYFLRGDAENDRRWTVLAGAALGAALMFGETPLFAALVYPGYAVLCGRPRRRHWLFALACGAVLVAEAAVTGLLTGDPLVRLRALAIADTVRSTNFDVAEAGWNLAWIAQPLLRAITEQEFGLYLILGLPLAAVRLMRSTNVVERSLALWIIILFLWISYGSVSPLVYAPLARLPRYLSIIQIPLVLLLAAAAQRLSTAVRVSLVGIVIATSLACVAVDGSRSRAAPYEALRGLVQRQSPRLAVVDADLHHPYLFFSGYAPGERVGLLRGIPDPVVVDLDGDRFDVSELTAGTLLVARRPEIRLWLADQPQLRTLATFPPPDDLYHRLLRNPHVQAILSIGRSEFRMRALRGTAGGDGTIEVYQIH